MIAGRRLKLGRRPSNGAVKDRMIWNFRMDTATSKVTSYKDPLLPARPNVSAGPDWTGGLATLSTADAEILLSAVQTLYPHENLDPLIYRRVIIHFDRLAAAEKAASLFAVFCESLRQAEPLPFSDLSESYRIQALKRIELEPAFFFVQRMAVRYLYDDVEVWAAFGYEGASVHLGGYVTRGFNDLDWLPPLPNEI